MNQLRLINRLNPQRSFFMSATQLGSRDAGGSGEAGAIRGAGGAFGKKEAAAEERYFREVQANQLKDLKTHMSDEVSFHEEQIKRHQDALEKAKEKLSQLSKGQ